MRAAGKAVLFATEDVVVGDSERWLERGVRDVPHPGERIAAARPVRTIVATRRSRTRRWPGSRGRPRRGARSCGWRWRGWPRRRARGGRLCDDIEVTADGADVDVRARRLVVAERGGNLSFCSPASTGGARRPRRGARTLWPRSFERRARRSSNGLGQIQRRGAALCGRAGGGGWGRVVPSAGAAANLVADQAGSGPGAARASPKICDGVELLFARGARTGSPTNLRPLARLCSRPWCLRQTRALVVDARAQTASAERDRCVRRSAGSAPRLSRRVGAALRWRGALDATGSTSWWTTGRRTAVALVLGARAPRRGIPGRRRSTKLAGAGAVLARVRPSRRLATPGHVRAARRRERVLASKTCATWWYWLSAAGELRARRPARTVLA